LKSRLGIGQRCNTKEWHRPMPSPTSRRCVLCALLEFFVWQS
jgi:hypothetical protein